MGYVAQRKTVKLQFETPEHAGMEVSARVLSLGELLEVADQADRARAGAGLSEVRNLVKVFADALAGWNLERADGSAVPKTLAGVMSLDTDLALTMILAWFDGMVSIGSHLGKGSSSGRQFPEVSIPMETLSESPTNWPTPN